MLTTLGRTGLLASRIGLGLAALGRPGYINLGHSSDLAGQTDVESMERVAHAVLDAAYNRGVRYFDVARSYGKGETFLADWLHGRSLGPSDVTVGSKWGYTYTAGWRVDAPVHEVKDLSLGPSAASSSRAGSCWARTCAFTRSTPAPSRARSWRTTRCSTSWRGCEPPVWR